MNDPALTAEQRLQRIRKLTEVSRAMTYAASLDEVLQLAVDRAADLFGAEKSLLLVASDAGVLTLRASHGVDGAAMKDFHPPLDEAVVARLATILDSPVERLLSVPLVARGGIRGLLVVARPPEAVAVDHDEWLLSALADQAAVAMEKTRLDQIGEFREQLMGIVGHDLRNPLNTILMAARILVMREGLGARETELARKITTSGLVAARLIDQLLDLTRSRLGGGIPIDPARLDLNVVCQQVVAENELTHPERRLNVDIRGDVIGFWDRDRMYQLLANLVGNAVQHGEASSPIDLRVHGGETAVVIEVANRGEPIPAATLPFIFDAFRQGRLVHPSRSHGLGLGLFIAREIAHAHGGSIEAASSAIDGTLFRVQLPREGAKAR
jgi:signal transduction histidine kinase